MVVAVNVAVDWPAVTVAEAGTVTAPLLLASVTVALAKAALVSVTVPVEEVPPITDAGLSVTDAIAGFTEMLRLAVAV